MFVTAVVHMLDLSPIWQAPAIRRALFWFELSEIAGVLVCFARVILNAKNSMWGYLLLKMEGY